MGGKVQRPVIAIVSGIGIPGQAESGAFPFRLEGGTRIIVPEVSDRIIRKLPSVLIPVQLFLVFRKSIGQAARAFLAEVIGDVPVPVIAFREFKIPPVPFGGEGRSAVIFFRLDRIAVRIVFREAIAVMPFLVFGAEFRPAAYGADTGAMVIRLAFVQVIALRRNTRGERQDIPLIRQPDPLVIRRRYFNWTGGFFPRAGFIVQMPEAVVIPGLIADAVVTFLGQVIIAGQILRETGSPVKITPAQEMTVRYRPRSVNPLLFRAVEPCPRPAAVVIQEISVQIITFYRLLVQGNLTDAPFRRNLPALISPVDRQGASRDIRLFPSGIIPQVPGCAAVI